MECVSVWPHPAGAGEECRGGGPYGSFQGLPERCPCLARWEEDTGVVVSGITVLLACTSAGQSHSVCTLLCARHWKGLWVQQEARLMAIQSSRPKLSAVDLETLPKPAVAGNRECGPLGSWCCPADCSGGRRHFCVCYLLAGVARGQTPAAVHGEPLRLPAWDLQPSSSWFRGQQGPWGCAWWLGCAEACLGPWCPRWVSRPPDICKSLNLTQALSCSPRRSDPADSAWLNTCCSPGTSRYATGTGSSQWACGAGLLQQAVFATCRVNLPPDFSLTCPFPLLCCRCPDPPVSPLLDICWSLPRSP